MGISTSIRYDVFFHELLALKDPTALDLQLFSRFVVHRQGKYSQRRASRLCSCKGLIASDYSHDNAHRIGEHKLRSNVSSIHIHKQLIPGCYVYVVDDTDKTTDGSEKSITESFL